MNDKEVKHVHSWETEVAKRRLRMRTTGMRSIQIIEHTKGWTVWRIWMTRENRFGIWKKESKVESLIEALDLANTFRNEECNPLGICNSYWHIEAHSCHSTCPQCSQRGFDQELKKAYSVSHAKRKTSVVVPTGLRC